MTRLLSAVIGLGLALPLVAAPVPTHLFPKDPPLYHPIRKGTRWVYLEGGDEHRYVVTEVQKSKSGDATLVSIAEVTDKKQTPYRKMEVSRNGLLWVETGGSAFDKPLRMLRCPVHTNDTWSFETSGPGGIVRSEGTMKVVGIEQVKVPAGTFSAVRVEEEFTLGGGDYKHHSTYWYAPEVGLVKEEYGNSTAVLKSFTPGN
jgi:hypothetical protein